MHSRFMVLAAVFAFVASLAVVSCTGDEYDQQTRPINDNEDDHAKDRAGDQRCDEYDFVITDCFDACNCCIPYDGNEPAPGSDPLGQCIQYCDGVLIKIDEVENPTKTDIDNFKECVVGCFSICGKDDKDVACWNECKGYLGE